MRRKGNQRYCKGAKGQGQTRQRRDSNLTREFHLRCHDWFPKSKHCRFQKQKRLVVFKFVFSVLKNKWLVFFLKSLRPLPKKYGTLKSVELELDHEWWTPMVMGFRCWDPSCSTDPQTPSKSTPSVFQIVQIESHSRQIHSVEHSAYEICLCLQKMDHETIRISRKSSKHHDSQCFERGFQQVDQVQ